MDRDTLFGPKRIKARAIDRDQIHADFHQGARLSRRISDAVYMAAADQMQKPNNNLAMQEPSIHGPRECPRVVEVSGLAVHGDFGLGPFQPVGPVERRELAALIRVHDFWRAELMDRLVQRLEAELRK